MEEDLEMIEEKVQKMTLNWLASQYRDESSFLLSLTLSSFGFMEERSPVAQQPFKLETLQFVQV